MLSDVPRVRRHMVKPAARCSLPCCSKSMRSVLPNRRQRGATRGSEDVLNLVLELRAKPRDKVYLHQLNLVCFITLPPRVSKALENPSGNRWYVESSQGALQRLSCRNIDPRGTARHSHSGQFGAEAV